MKGYERLLAVLIAATLVAGVAGVLVKDTTPGDMAGGVPTPTQTFSPTQTTSPTTEPTRQASPTPTKTKRPKPKPKPTTAPRQPKTTPKTGVASNLALAIVLLGAALVLDRVRRRPI